MFRNRSFRAKEMASQSQKDILKEASENSKIANRLLELGQQETLPEVQYQLFLKAAEYFRKNLSVPSKENQDVMKLKLLDVYRGILCLCIEKKLSSHEIAKIEPDYHEKMKNMLDQFPLSESTAEDELRTLELFEIENLAALYARHAFYQYCLAVNHKESGDHDRAAEAFQATQRYSQHEYDLAKSFDSEEQVLPIIRSKLVMLQDFLDELAEKKPESNFKLIP